MPNAWIQSPNTNIQSQGTLFSQLSANASISNSVINLPWILPTAWASGATIVQGNVRSNAGNWYVATNSGTTGVTAPTHTSGAVVSDGAVSWTYIGRPQISSSDANAPTITTSSSTPAGLTHYQDPVNYPGVFSFRGANAVFYASTFIQMKAFYESASSLTSVRSSVECMVDDYKFAVGFTNGSAVVRIAVNDKYISTDCFLPVAGSPNWIVIDFTSVAVQKPLKLRVDFAGGTPSFAGVRTTSNGRVYAISTSNSVRCVSISDSMFAGSSMGPFITGFTAPFQMCQRLGWNDSWEMSVGGTGYVNTGASKYNFLQRTQDASNAAIIATANVVVLMGSTNDISQANVATNVTATLRQIRSINPTCTIVVFGLYPINNAGVSSTESLVQTGVTNFNDTIRKTFFIPLYAMSPIPLVTGAWNNSADTGSTNANLYISTDNTHPADIGTAYLGAMMAQSIQNNVIPYIN